MLLLLLTVQCFAIFSSLTGGTTTNSEPFWNSDTVDLNGQNCTKLLPPQVLHITQNRTFTVIGWNIDQPNTWCIPEEINITCTAQDGKAIVRIYQIFSESVEEELTTNVTDLDDGIEYACRGKLRMGFILSNYSSATSPGQTNNISRTISVVKTPLESSSVSETQSTIIPITTNVDLITIDGHVTASKSSDDFSDYSDSDNLTIITSTADVWLTESTTDLTTTESGLITGDTVTSISTRTSNSMAPTEVSPVPDSDNLTTITSTADVWLTESTTDLTTTESGLITGDAVTSIGIRTSNSMAPTEVSTVPDGFINISLEDVGSKYISITWEITNDEAVPWFNVAIELIDVGWINNETACNFTINRNYNVTCKHHNFTSLIPYSSYKISVETSEGAIAYKEVNTNEAKPDKPLNINFTLESKTAKVYWNAPCNVNGDGAYFNVRVKGYYTEDSASTERTISSESVPFHRNKEFSYSYSYPFAEYSYRLTISVFIVLKSGEQGQLGQISLITPLGIPGKPVVSIENIESKSFDIFIEAPKNKTGAISCYQIFIYNQGPVNIADRYRSDCDYEPFLFTEIMYPYYGFYCFKLAFPYFRYRIAVRAINEEFDGEFSEDITTNTEAAAPDNIESLSCIESQNITAEVYNVQLAVTFEEQCFMNDGFRTYQIIIDHQNVNIVTENITGYRYYFKNVEPASKYEIKVKTITEKYENTSKSLEYLSSAGVPSLITLESVPIKIDDSAVNVTLRKNLFDDKYGKMEFLALILSDLNSSGGYYERWNVNWPPVYDNKTKFYYQLTPDFWNPFEDLVEEASFNIGEAQCGKQTCSEALTTGKEYYLTVRVFNAKFYRNSQPISLCLEKSQVGLILGIIFGILILCGIIILGFLIWKRKLPSFVKVYRRKSSMKPLAKPSTRIRHNSFPEYVKSLESNPVRYKEQFTELSERTKDIIASQDTTYAVLPENRRKNRYVNILPYDVTRVKLLVDEDDEASTDYINASFIRGYSGNTEYIATQGPLPSTSRAFWKMVLQEEVRLIVMVSQFIENSKEKVFRYFPKNKGAMKIGEDIMVKCISNVHFGSYCIRTLLVQSNTQHVMCTHLQYLHWPDFGVPDNTQSMLQFCYQIRERYKYEGGPIVVHCSAGVGRTGTIIATDILLQYYNAKRDIDVFNTVLDLRRQRINMVQTEQQYIYIHTLIKDYIERPPTFHLVENIVPGCENIGYRKSALIDEIQESGF